MKRNKTHQVFSRANNPPTTNPIIPPSATFDLYDDDESEFRIYSVPSEEDGDLGAIVTDALDHYQQFEAERLASIAQQSHVHLESAASQTLPIAHAIAEQQ